MIGIGIDTGGTCTDAVIYDINSKEVLASAKSRTTHEQLEVGIGESIGKLPRHLIDQASYISLSTTLATNACVENKGARVALIFIGVEPKTIEETYKNYGFESTDFIYYLEADSNKGIAPDWEKLDLMLPEIFAQYDSIAISQLFPRANNGQYEKDAKERILAQRDITVVCGFELFNDLNVIKRGAGALLNARLIPVIEDFFKAVHRVLNDQNIDLPFLIMRSDGSLVSEEYSKEYPVETLLCGPTASAKGAVELLPEDQAIVVDMGGTTSDISLIKNGEPKVSPTGVKVGGWETFVRGIEVDTFALGGDTHVTYDKLDVILGTRRIIPISLLAGMYPSVLDELRKQASRRKGLGTPLYEHLVLMRDISGREELYTQAELEICKALQNGPLGICQIADAVGTSAFHLVTKRLEKEGVVQRAGFTPSDAMLLKGDRSDSGLSYEAAECAAQFIGKTIHQNMEFVVEETYRLVKERLFCNLVRILWEDAKETNKNLVIPNNLEELAKASFAYKPKEGAPCFFQHIFKTDATLLGVGAPTHVFIEEVASALGTKSKTSEYSGVTNALGALLGEACVYETVFVEPSRANVDDSEKDTSYIVQGDTLEYFDSESEAIERAGEIAMDRAKQKVILCGASDIYSLTYESTVKTVDTNLNITIRLGATVTACARGRFSF